ncbi:DUF1048 domain-containing protein [Cytobacillus horneckiae]|uniref:DUF1048 domain-containing protein n=1 Tax=Cytobacillus horneckiae TaxID=549687 RepID=UPI0039A3A52B
MTDWQEMKSVFHHIIDFLEEAAADGKRVKAGIGNDVAAFCMISSLMQNRGLISNVKNSTMRLNNRTLLNSLVS